MMVDEAVQRIAGTWEYVLPEIFLVVAACVYFLLGPFLVNERGEGPSGLRHSWGGFALFSLLAAGIVWWRIPPEVGAESLGLFRADQLAWFVRGLSLASGVILLLTTWNHVEGKHVAEHHACLLLATAGTSLVVAANDLVVLFLALELVSFATYVLLYLGREDAACQEAVVKYFLLSVFSSAMVLFGMSYLYGATGTTNLTAIGTILAAGGDGPMPSSLFVAIGAIVAGLGFRVAIVPFHYYAPDVFQGSAVGGAAFLSYIPKVAGFIALLRLLAIPVDVEAAWSLIDRAAPFLWVLAALSMTVGNVLALLQNDVRRLMAYSSIAHAGYMLVGLAAVPEAGGSVSGAPAMLFYLAVYGAMTLGVFAILAVIQARSGGESSGDTSIFSLTGLGRTHPATAFLMAVFLFSLTGLPPTAGFFAKLNIFLVAWSAETAVAHWTAALMALNAAIAAWYYLRLVALMYVPSPSEAAPASLDRPWQAAAWPALAGATLCAVAVVGIFFAPNWLWQAALRGGG